ncbi:hypothetical protein R3X27_00045 [Tropicimonas sp. TH_r6]|uniref:hypothetical protein n=1 Tax=Tropicimonas sp. TH_r6 TaxID=3082085 RepID=UPI0029547753|nr:hypothetical protein [Tropicimonas sp. TH_r6]MDV7141059.1 hypothetical protein [Tropicimonas sp. TH_r6]
MRNALRFFLKEQPVAFGIFAAALLVMLFFGGKFLLHLGDFHGRVPREQALEAWMRPRYVSMSYHLPPKVLREEILKIGPPPKDREREPITMEEIAAQKGVTLEELTGIVRAGAEAFHEERRK